MKKSYILFIWLFILPGIGFSQKDGGATKITVFKPEEAKPVTSDDPLVHIRDKNNIKWNYSLLSRGVFLLNYEFYLNPKFTGEVGAGMTLRDYIFETFKGYSLLESNRSSNPSFCAEGGIRFYPKGFDNFEGVFLSPNISYRNYVLGNQSSQSGNRTTTSAFVPGYSFWDIQFKFGYQYESFWIDDLYGEIYIGFALRNATINYLQESYSNNSNNTVIYTPTVAKESYAQPLIGFKIGVPF